MLAELRSGLLFGGNLTVREIQALEVLKLMEKPLPEKGQFLR
jgi:hypothetical protein